MGEDFVSADYIRSGIGGFGAAQQASRNQQSLLAGALGELQGQQDWAAALGQAQSLRCPYCPGHHRASECDVIRLQERESLRDALGRPAIIGTAPTYSNGTTPFQIQNKQQEKKPMLSRLKDYLRKHEDIFFTLAIAMLVDHFFFNGAFRQKIEAIVEKMLDSVSRRVQKHDELEGA
jgi:uncharacterized protein (DUF2164 family)